MPPPGSGCPHEGVGGLSRSGAGSEPQAATMFVGGHASPPGIRVAADHGQRERSDPDGDAEPEVSTVAHAVSQASTLQRDSRVEAGGR
jgi:hypothetical protein